MKIRIFQVNTDRDYYGMAFEDLNSAINRCGGSPPSGVYDLVYDGNTDCESLEDIYREFNIDKPEEFKGRSLSVSDVVEVTNDQGNAAFYYCDNIGFKKIEFEPEKARGLTMRVVLLEPGKMARVADIGTSLEDMQRTVEGYIEAYYPFDEDVCIVCNEEGKLQGLQLNRAIREPDVIEEMSYSDLRREFCKAEEAGRHITGYIVFTEDSFDKKYSEAERTYAVSSDNKAFQSGMGGYSIYGSSLEGGDHARLENYMADERGGKDGWKIERCYTKTPGRAILDVIAGPCFICDCSGENFGSLSEEQLKRYSDKFRLPEYFISINGQIAAVPFEPKEKNEAR